MKDDGVTSDRNKEQDDDLPRDERNRNMEWNGASFLFFKFIFCF